MNRSAELKQIIERFQGIRILCIGDIMVDRYIIGTANRISPEAPVPVVEVISDTWKMGGAANVMHNIRTLGGKVSAAGVVGSDLNGDKLIDLLLKSGIETAGIVRDTERPTTTKTRIIVGQQQIVRVDREKRTDVAAAHISSIMDFVRENIDHFHAVILSDYDKGLLTGFFVGEVIALAKSRRIPVIVDPKYTHFHYYTGATIITPNLNEACAATGITPINETSIRNMGNNILHKLGCEAVLITRGKEGMSLFDREGNQMRIPTTAHEVFDVSGAGDTVTSVVALSYVAGASMVDAAVLSNMAAGIVVGKPGTAMVTGDELQDYMGKTDIDDLYSRNRS